MPAHRNLNSCSYVETEIDDTEANNNMITTQTNKQANKQTNQQTNKQKENKQQK